MTHTTPLTASQQAALDGEGGQFTAKIAADGHVEFVTAEGELLPFTIWAGWSSLRGGIPVIAVNTGREVREAAWIAAGTWGDEIDPVILVDEDDVVYDPARVYTG
ncbi:hypothetical protein [Agromyces humi]|uniref:hypothetical protein n=1 Tax=Agromyces humi TaxID=1766800 RepID=UPI001356FDD6|nr:hypothetical protein [Agromyces humi]